MTPLDFVPVLPGVSLSRVIILIPIVGFFLYLNKVKIKLDAILIISVLYFAMNLLSYFYTVDSATTIQRIATIGSNLGVILLLSTLSYNEKELKLLIKSIIYSGWMTILIIIFFQDVNSIEGRMTVSINGVYQDPNYLNGFLLIPIIYYLNDYLNNKRKKSLISLCIFISCVIMTGSRGGLIAVILSSVILLIVWMINNKNKLSTIVSLLIMSFFSGVVIYLSMKLLPENLMDRFSYSAVVESGGSGRIGIWNQIIGDFNELNIFNKLFGNGAGTVTYFTNGYAGHNIWLDSLIELGILGSIVLFVFYLTILIISLKNKLLILALSFIGYMVMGMSMSLFSFKPIWSLILLILIINNYKRNNNQAIMSK